MRPPPRPAPAIGRPEGRPSRDGLSKAGEAISRPGDTWALGPHRLACALAPDEAFLAIDAAIRAWQALSGDEARLHPGGPTFDAVAGARAEGAVQ